MNLNNFSKAIVSSSHKNNGQHHGTLPRNSKSEDDLLSRNNIVITKKCNREGCTNTVFKEVCTVCVKSRVNAPVKIFSDFFIFWSIHKGQNEILADQEKTLALMVDSQCPEMI